MIIRVSPKFEKQYKRLPKKIKEQAKEKEGIFRVYPFDPSLKTHKLSGKDSGCWAFWINYSYRIKFIFINQSEVLFLEVGLHNIYN
ncbi:MAG: type II toxin-antitoxin system mRNA interferase toxin, RelE/StbE family [Candidatus Gribaldobacteria bacterium]|nr:type II toxin-antitoxin system mRNA interferase toxin, RelE/StbE family [Candidatus Gribaldobacteria bacterium]